MQHKTNKEVLDAQLAWTCRLVWTVAIQVWVKAGFTMTLSNTNRPCQTKKESFSIWVMCGFGSAWKSTMSDHYENCTLRDIYLVVFLSFCTRETTLVTSCMLFCTPNPFWKRVCSKRKEFAPKGSKFFPFRVDPFSEGSQNNFDRAASLRVHQFPWTTFVATWFYTGNIADPDLHKPFHNHSSRLVGYLD